MIVLRAKDSILRRYNEMFIKAELKKLVKSQLTEMEVWLINMAKKDVIKALD